MTDPSALLAFRPVDITNYYQVMKLELVPGQERFLDKNSWPLAEAAYVKGFTPEAVYLGERLIGLVSWGPYYPDYGYRKQPEAGSFIVDHIMIEADFQGRGLGRRTMQMLMAKLATLPDCRRIIIMHDPRNRLAERLYLSLGFREIGRTHEDDVILAQDVSDIPGQE